MLVHHHAMLFAGFAKGGEPVFIDKSSATDWSTVRRCLGAEAVVWAHVQQVRRGLRVHSLCAHLTACCCRTSSCSASSCRTRHAAWAAS